LQSLPQKKRSPKKSTKQSIVSSQFSQKEQRDVCVSMLPLFIFSAYINYNSHIMKL